jgi:hypothetical protein
MARPSASTLKMTYSPWLNRAGLRSADSVVGQMADDLLVAVANEGCVTEQELELLGWTPAQIASHARAASRRALARAARRGETTAP